MRGKAVSGRPGYQSPEYQHLKDKGPLPEGRYGVNQDQYQKGVVTEALIPLYNLRITSVRLPNEDELGLGDTINMTLAD